MRVALVFLTMLFALAACAEFNRPIEPGDDWRERGTRDYSLPRY